ncbi:unnamed protein product [Camellia sinensis]
MGEGGKERGVASADPPQPQYGTFQGVANYPPPPPPPPPQPVIGFPQPVPPPGSSEPYANAYQGVPVVMLLLKEDLYESVAFLVVVVGVVGSWFIIGFFLGAIPWYVGAVILLCVRTVDYREKPGYIACTIAAVLATIAIIVGATSADW